MAKTKRTKKSQKQIMLEETRIRLYSVLTLFVLVIATLRLGIIGHYLHLIVSFLVGNLYGVFYLGNAILSLYILIKAKLPKLNSPEAVSLYISMTAIFILMTYPSSNIKGFDVINSYLASQTFNKGGFVGAIFFALLSALFDNLGAMIAGGFLLVIGSLMLIGKLYIKNKGKLDSLKQNKKEKPKKHEIDENVEKIILETKPLLPIFRKKQIVIFPDKVFDDDNIKDEPIEEEITSAFEFNEEKIQLEVKEVIPKIKTPVKEEKVLKPVERKPLKDYKFPPLSLLKTKSTNNYMNEKASAQENARKLTAVLKQFGVRTTVENVAIGPSITKYELKLEVGTRVNKILQLQDDIKLALATADIRIEAPIPGKPYVGIEVPNSKPSVVAFKDVYQGAFQKVSVEENKLGVVLGKDISGKPIIAELDKMPHLLIAGATGSGKSVCINTIITSLLMRTHPDEVKLILVDPKKVELSIYNGVPHLLTPVVTDPKKAAGVLREVVSEMERRYDVFASVNARNIKGYNEYAKEYNSKANDEELKEILSYQVVILDEVADLMMVASKEVEDCIMRIAQMARAAGIHLIVATQRPSTDIITGVIKANIPSRIAFAVSSSIDSRTILDTSGAEKLLGKGDMLFSPMGSSSPIRVQGAFVSDDEVAEIVHFVSQQREAVYEEKYMNVKSVGGSSSFDDDDNDEEYEQCREFVIQTQKASTSLLQRRFKIGYNKAARIIDQLEENGIIGPQNGSKPREVYVKQYSEEDF
ncbi:MAG: DNA translocase FtsK [Bacilli bacterium]|nr:DNA translocase FtsK [Bacilli bacterium]